MPPASLTRSVTRLKTLTLGEYAVRARTELDVLPPCPARDALELLAHYVVARTR